MRLKRWDEMTARDKVVQDKRARDFKNEQIGNRTFICAVQSMLPPKRKEKGWSWTSFIIGFLAMVIIIILAGAIAAYFAPMTGGCA